jgi:hypothetical protein
MTYYILLDGKPVPEPDYDKWKAWSDANPEMRGVAHDDIDGALISTIFHGVVQDGSLHVWETRIFGGALDQVTDRCAGTREQAEAMHARMVKRVKSLKA